MNWSTINLPLKSSKLGRGIAFFAIATSIFFLIGILWLNPHSSIIINQNCYASQSGNGYCNMTCIYNVSRNSYGRITVTHTVWAAIYEDRFNISKGEIKIVQIQVPTRNYTYILRSVFWTDSKNYGATKVNLIC